MAGCTSSPPHPGAGPVPTLGASVQSLDVVLSTTIYNEFFIGSIG